MELKERHFNESQVQYQLAMDYFEDVGQRLFSILKAKEQIETKLNSSMKTRVKAFELVNTHEQLERLKQQENELQAKVHQARVNLNDKEEKRTKAHFEFKKLEKVKERRVMDIKQRLKSEENQQLDEISVQQYVRLNG